MDRRLQRHENPVPGAANRVDGVTESAYLALILLRTL
jgi:hypothetical protein